MFLKIGDYCGKLIGFHWGFWLIPMGWLFYKSGFIPRILGILLLVNGLGFIITSTTFILYPEYFEAVLKIVFPALVVGEIPLMFWLMIKGTKSSSQHSYEAQIKV